VCQQRGRAGPEEEECLLCVCAKGSCDAEKRVGSLKRVGVTPWQDCAAVCTSQSYDRGQE
jgi:hypothetical protein